MTSLRHACSFALAAAFLLLSSHVLAAQTGDSIFVQTFSFGDQPRVQSWGHIYNYDSTFTNFPTTGSYRKVLMLYTLKCDPATTADGFNCGEWDYSTFTFVHTDSQTKYEIGRFITPYGINLDLGADGFTWVFDVSDYLPLLMRDEVRISAGNNQELLDLKFLFIRGMPAREVKSVTKLWSEGSPGYADIVEDKALAPIQVTLDPSASMYRINARPQGGNFNGGDNTDNCAEFCDREHWITVNGTERFRWNVWKECGDNPVYPQGGTWLLDRAGWCPGAPVNTAQLELTPYVTPGQQVTIDYGIENPSQFVPYGHWVFWADLIAYGPPTHSLDASVERIIAPSTEDLYNRRNPICSGPVIVVRNTGSTPLTSLTVEYGAGDLESLNRFEWSGNLQFLEEDTVELPAISWPAGEGTFRVEISSPNGQVDQYVRNNVALSEFTSPPVYPDNFVMELRTNQYANEQYEWVITDALGNVMLSGENLQSDHTYSYPVELDPGCYVLQFRNVLGYGLDYWAIRSQLGTGSLRFVAGSRPLVTFKPDFGNLIYHEFTVDQFPTAVGPDDTVDFGRVVLSSNNEEVVTIRPANPKGLEISDVKILGSAPITVVSTTPSLSGGPVTLGGEEEFTITLRFAPTQARTYNARLLVVTNDYQSGTLSIPMTGIGESPTDAPNREEVTGASVTITPAVVERDATVRVELPSRTSERVLVELVDVNGKRVALLYDGAARDLASDFHLDAAGLPSGTYWLRLQTPSENVVREVKVVR